MRIVLPEPLFAFGFMSPGNSLVSYRPSSKSWALYDIARRVAVPLPDGTLFVCPVSEREVIVVVRESGEIRIGYLDGQMRPLVPARDFMPESGFVAVSDEAVAIRGVGGTRVWLSRESCVLPPVEIDVVGDDALTMGHHLYREPNGGRLWLIAKGLDGTGSWCFEGSRWSKCGTLPRVASRVHEGVEDGHRVIGDCDRVVVICEHEWFDCDIRLAVSKKLTLPGIYDWLGPAAAKHGDYVAVQIGGKCSIVSLIDGDEVARVSLGQGESAWARIAKASDGFLLAMNGHRVGHVSLDAIRAHSGGRPIKPTVLLTAR